MLDTIILDYRNFHILLAGGSEGQDASPCQISLKSVTPLQSYHNFSIFQNDAVCHLGYVWDIFGPPTKGTWWSLSLALLKVIWEQVTLSPLWQRMDFLSIYRYVMVTSTVQHHIVPILYNGSAHVPSRLDPHLIHDSFGSSSSVQPFLQH